MFTCWVFPARSHLPERSHPWETLLPPSWPAPRDRRATETVCRPHRQPVHIHTYTVRRGVDASSSDAWFPVLFNASSWPLPTLSETGQYLMSVSDRSQASQKVRCLHVQMTVHWEKLVSSQSSKQLTDCGLSASSVEGWKVPKHYYKTTHAVKANQVIQFIKLCKGAGRSFLLHFYVRLDVLFHCWQNMLKAC